MPLAGRFAAPNGAPGAVAPVTVLVVDPLFETRTLSVTRPPVGTVPKSRRGGSDLSPACVP